MRNERRIIELLEAILSVFDGLARDLNIIQKDCLDCKILLESIEKNTNKGVEKEGK